MLTKDKINSILKEVFANKRVIDERISEICEICGKYFKFDDHKPVLEDNTDFYNKYYFSIEELVLNNDENKTMYVDCFSSYRSRNENSDEELPRYFFIDKFNDCVEFDNKIPVRWLWEDFEQELSDGFEKYKNRDSHLLEEITLEKTLLESAKLKLSEDECKLLNIDDKIFNINEGIKNSSERLAKKNS